jgi:hypothetical protein
MKLRVKRGVYFAGHIVLKASPGKKSPEALVSAGVCITSKDPVIGPLKAPAKTAKVTKLSAGYFPILSPRTVGGSHPVGFTMPHYLYPAKDAFEGLPKNFVMTLTRRMKKTVLVRIHTWNPQAFTDKDPYAKPVTMTALKNVVHGKEPWAHTPFPGQRYEH